MQEVEMGGDVARMVEMRIAYKMLVCKPEGKKPLESYRHIMGR
jgi:hypothetical protein